jgi:hypothetical protein
MAEQTAAEKPRRRTYMMVVAALAFDASLIAFVAAGLVWALRS